MSGPNHFKLAVFWTAWTSQVATRIMRDVMALQRLASAKHCTLVVAADEVLHSKLRTLGVQISLNFTEPDMARVYIERGEEIPAELEDRFPDNVDVDTIRLGNADPIIQTTREDADPYAGVEFYKDWQSIPETMPLDGKTPPRNGEPMPSPLL